jgi:glycosyltransferase involved in cell wall biosynthesis
VKVINIFEDGQYGGPQAYMIALAKTLQGKVEFLFLVPEKNSEAFQNKCQLNEITYQLLPLTHISRNFKKAALYSLYFFYEIYKLYALFKKNDADYIYICGGSWQYKGAIAAKFARKKIIWHLNDCYMPWLFRKIFSLLSGFAIGYVCASNRTKKYYSKYLDKDKPVYVMPSPIDTGHFSKLNSPETDHALKECLENQFVVGSIGNINPIKGFEILIKAAKELEKFQDQIKFVIIGSVFPSQQKYYDGLQNIMRNLNVTNVMFYGPTYDVRPLLKRFDVYVCSSLSESSPISVWEAMSMEKLVISTDVGDVSEYLLNGQTGFVVDVGDQVTLANTLRDIYLKKFPLDKLKSNARAMAVENFDTQICADKHLHVFNELKKAQY